MTFTTGSFTGTLNDLTSVPRNGGKVLFVPSVDVIRDTTGHAVMRGTATAAVSNGTFTVTLPATDDATLDPSGFTYTIVPPAEWGPPVSGVALPAGSTRAYADLVSVNPATPTYQPGDVTRGEYNGVTGRLALLESDVVAHRPTGIAATDRAMLIQAIGDTPAGGHLFLPGDAAGGTFYTTDQTVAVTKNITIEGNSLSPVFPSNNDGTTPTGLSGTVIRQVTAGLDGLAITGSALSVNLRNLGVQFAAGLASTGHGINASPSALYPSTSGHTIGMNDFRWDNIQVYGHDGNHYGFVLLNPLLGLATHLRSYLGGGVNVRCDAGAINAGNIVFEDFYNELSNVGSAGGIIHTSAVASGVPGRLNLLTYVRPQVIMGGAAKAAGTQYMYDDRGGVAGSPTPEASDITLVADDFEGNGNPVRLGSSTRRVGAGLITGSSRPYPDTTVASGGGALPNPTGGNHTAVGYQALATMGDGTQPGTTTGSTGVGYQALKASTAGNNTALGAFAASSLTSGGSVVAVGFGALQNATASNSNTAVGRESLNAGAGSDGNTALGYQSAKSLNGGTGKNTFLGGLAGVTTNAANASVGTDRSLFVGYGAGQNTASNMTQVTALGYNSLVGSNYCGAIGANVVASGAGAWAIGTDSGGAGASATTSNQMVFGTANHTHKIPGLPARAFVASDKYVVIDSAGNLHVSATGPAS